jgi:hypothetical protein
MIRFPNILLGRRMESGATREQTSFPDGLTLERNAVVVVVFVVVAASAIAER